MSDKDNSLRKNFLKTQIFNFEQDLKSRAVDHVKRIDKALQEIETIENRLKELKDFITKEDIESNLQKYKFLLSLLRTNETELFNHIDHYYKFGNKPLSVFIDSKKEYEEKPKSKKTRVKKKKTET